MLGTLNKYWLYFWSRFFATPTWLNRLSEQDRKIVHSGPFARYIQAQGMARIAPIAWYFEPYMAPAGVVYVKNGSMFFLDCGDGPFAVTAGHVYRDYVWDKLNAWRIWCQVGDLEFDPEARFIATREAPDIATFSVTEADIRRIRKLITKPPKAEWPPPTPVVEQAVIVSGFPGQERKTTLRANGRPKTISFGYYAATTRVTSMVADQITCRFDPSAWVDARKKGLPEPGYPLGGISGAPLLVPDYVRRKWIVWPAGVITEAHSTPEWEEVKAAVSAYVMANGHLQLHI